jgi:hypothetical protein
MGAAEVFQRSWGVGSTEKREERIGFGDLPFQPSGRWKSKRV